MIQSYDEVQNEREAIRVALSIIEETGDVSRLKLRRKGIPDRFWQPRFKTFLKFRADLKGFGQCMEYDFQADIADLIAVYVAPGKDSDLYHRVYQRALDVLRLNKVVYGKERSDVA